MSTNNNNDSTVAAPAIVRTAADILEQIRSFFLREDRPDLFLEAQALLKPEDLAELITWPADSIERVACSFLINSVRWEGRIPRGEDVAARCVHCGRVWATRESAANAPRESGWPIVESCGWCFLRPLTECGFPIPRPANPDSIPPRELLDPRALSKLN